ncbi:MAG: hypothetical protein COB59_11395 [Rhodospirillaceae bacterium]|nr:MAG: hypothetical protein COB59_11395 [Rhodospirillaceae bacterium]
MNNETHSQNMRGIALVLLGAFLLSVMDGVMKHLLEQGYSVLQMMAVRGWFMVPIMLVWAKWKLPSGALKTTRPGIHFLRVIIGFGAPLFFFTSLQTMHLADATVIVFGSTFLMTALSVPLLKEHVGPHRWAAVVIGMVGVVIAANPTADFISGGAFYAMFASLAYALMMLITRWMGPGESAFKQVFYFNVWSASVATAFSISEFISMPMADIAWVFLTGALSVLGHLSLTRAFSIAPVGLVAPFEYSFMIWSTLIGFLVWGYIPGSSIMTGAAIIVASGFYLIHRERQQKTSA